MSKEHYVTPDEFDRLVFTGELERIGYAMYLGEEQVTRRVIDSIRELNRQDPGFKYSCRCADEETIWTFGYTDHAIYELVDKKMDEGILAWRKEIGDDGAEIIYSNVPPNTTICSCPFDM